eukprot:11585689-Ditylum_brightwellii.AAC.1
MDSHTMVYTHVGDKNENEESGHWISVPTPKSMAPKLAHTATLVEMELLIKTTLQEEQTIPEEAGIKAATGEYNGLMWPWTYTTDHPAAPLLAQYALEGCPVDCGEDWIQAHIEAAIQHGPHKSA